MLLTTTHVLLSLLSAAPSPAPEPLCDKRAPCSVSETMDAGKDAQGQRLQVLALSLGWLGEEEGLKAVGRKFTAAGRKDKGSWDDQQCEASEWWLRRPGAPDQLLLSVCNNGYGAAGMGEDNVTAEKNRFTHNQFGGSNQRYSHSTTVQLSPLLRVSESQVSFFSFNPDGGTDQKWESATLKGGLELSEACGDGVKSLGKRVLPYLPRIQVDPAYLQEGWKQVALGTCALAADSVLLGGKVAPPDAALKAVLLGRDALLLEVRDNRWTGPSDKWLADDHVELWLGPNAPGDMDGCGKPLADDRPVQWGIRVTDGQVFPAYGSPTQALAVDKVELREADKVVGYRLKVTLPGEFQAVSVVYSDSDAGKKQERMLGTSPLKFARSETLNPLREVPPEEATCVVRGSALAVEPTPLKPQGPDVAVIVGG